MLNNSAENVNEPIAIVGIGCRFPGEANDINSFWENLLQGKDVLSVVPASRWNIDQYYDAQPGKTDKMYTKHSYFLSDVKRFDPLFFGISGREAVFMDPQQRLLLETGWEAVEQAGISMKSLQQKTTGVYVGCMNYDYAQLVATAEDVDLHANTGTTPSALSGRIAHVFGLHGPVLTLDTACSSSLLAAHLACQSLRIGEIEAALVGGVNLQLTPFTTVMECAGKMLSPDGRCKVFSDKADGFGRGDACAVIVLMRLADAVKEKLPIIALIHGSSVSHDGSSGAMTVPNGMAQEAVIKQALINSNITPEEIDYVEAHGTGTALGDPIEIQALDHIYGKNRSKDNFLWVGSVKANIGHTEAVAGIASLIKTALMLRHKKLVPQLHFEPPSRKIAWENLKVRINTSLQPWQRSDANYYAGVSSFGLSGTNVHMIIGAYENEREVVVDNNFLLPLCLSAQTPAALLQIIERYLIFLKTVEDASYANVTYTSCVGRVPFKYRLALACKSKADAVSALTKLISEQTTFENYKIPIVRSEFMIILSDYVETTQKNQLWNLPVYQDAIKTSQGVLEPLLTPMKDAPSSDRLKAVSVNFMHLYAYGRLLQALGLSPTLYLAKEVGLLAAAVLVGALRLQDIPDLLKALFSDDISHQQKNIKSALQKINLHRPAIPIASLTTGQIFELAEMANFLALFEHSSGKNELLILLEDISSAILVGQELEILSKIKAKKAKFVVHQISANLNDEKTLWEQSLHAIMHLYLQGYSINWEHLFAQQPACCVLPTYPFQRDVYWVKEKQHSEWQFSKRVTKNDVQLQNKQGQFFELPDKSMCYQMKFDIHSQDYWNDHKLGQSVVLPGVFNIQVILEFVKTISPTKLFEITMLTFHKMAVLSSTNDTIFHAVFIPETSGNWIFKSYTREKDTWQLLASAKLIEKFQIDSIKIPIDIVTAQTEWKKTVDGKALYRGHEQLGYRLGKPFQWLSSGFYLNGETVRGIQHPDVQLADENLYALYPGLIDACMQCYDSNGHESAMHVESDKIYVPFHIKKISFAGNFTVNEPAWAYAVMRNKKEDYLNSSTGDIVLFQKDHVVFQMEGVEYRKSAIEISTQNPVENTQKSSFYQLTWQIETKPALLKEKTSAIVIQMGGIAIEQLRDNAAIDFIHYPEIRNWSDETLKTTLNQDLNRILAASDEPIHLFICCPDDQNGVLTEESIKRYPAQYLRVLISMLQTLSTQRKLFLIIVTFKGQPVLNSDEVNPLQSMLWGIGRVIRHECNYLQCHLVDIENTSDLAWLIQRLSPNREWQLAYRDYLSYVPRLNVLTPRSQKEFICRPDKSYLIFGGTGGLGISCCRLLAQKGATKIILISRTGQLKETGLRDELQAMGVQLKLQSLDVLNQQAVHDYLKSLNQHSAIGGIVYAVGVLNDSPIEKQTQTSFDKVILPKILGLWYVWIALREQQMDFFAIFSSISATWGTYGQSGYAAANAFLEGFSCYIKTPYPLISIAWGPWSEAGLAARQAAHLAPIFKEAGIEWIEPSKGNILLSQALAANISPSIAGYFDWQQQAKVMPEADKQTWLSSLLSTPREEQISLPIKGNSADICLEIIATVMKVPKQQIDPDQLLNVMGLDSVMALEISSAIHEQFGVEIPLVLLLESATVNWLVQHILSQKTQHEPDKTKLVIDHCIEIVATVMKLPQQQIDVDQMLNVMGLDSVMALEISSAIHEQFGIEIPLVMLLENASITWLANHIVNTDAHVIPQSTAQTKISAHNQEVMVEVIV